MHRIARQFLLFLSFALFTLPSFADEVTRTIDQRYGLSDAERVHILVPYGSLRVEPGSDETVAVEVKLTCGRTDDTKCQKRAERIRLNAKVRRGELKIKLERTGSSKMRGIHTEVILRLPAIVPLEVDQRGGDVFVTGMEADLLVGAVAGDVDIVAIQEQTREIEIDVGIGSAELFLEDSTIEGAGFPKQLRWKGSGTSRISVNLGTGDVQVRFSEDS